jgi:hypothetical protein
MATIYSAVTSTADPISINFRHGHVMVPSETVREWMNSSAKCLRQSADLRRWFTLALHFSM